jgi:hypothetical protein
MAAARRFEDRPELAAFLAEPALLGRAGEKKTEHDLAVLPAAPEVEEDLFRAAEGRKAAADLREAPAERRRVGGSRAAGSPRTRGFSKI